jgi:hypothetical protein
MFVRHSCVMLGSCSFRIRKRSAMTHGARFVRWVSTMSRWVRDIKVDLRPPGGPPSSLRSGR